MTDPARELARCAREAEQCWQGDAPAWLLLMAWADWQAEAWYIRQEMERKA